MIIYYIYFPTYLWNNFFKNRSWVYECIICNNWYSIIIIFTQIIWRKRFSGRILVIFLLSAIVLAFKLYIVISALTFSFNTFLVILVLLLQYLFISLVFTVCWYIAYRITRTAFSFIFFGGLITLLLFYLFYFILHKINNIIATKVIILYLLN